MFLNDIEYFTLRLIRKYFFTYDFLTRYGNFIPYYKITSGQFSPTAIVDRYLKIALKENLDIRDKNILELGVGATNSTCYELAACGAKECYAYELYVKFNKKLDDKIIAQNPRYKKVLNKVIRIEDLNKADSGNFDIVLSNSVLQYMEDMNALCRQIRRVMNDHAWMAHRIDCRDHFFKYPFHFYKFSKKTWKIINPGLSRLRGNDYIRILNDNGFDAKIFDRTIWMEEFLRFRIGNKIHEEFSRYSDDDLATIMAFVFARKKV